MTWLALDTSSDRASAAAGRSVADAIERHADGSRSHARTLLTLMDEVLLARETSAAALQGVIIADGPGSFTGLRVAAAVAKGLHDALRLPVYVGSTLAARAVGALNSGDGRAVVLSDALRGDVYRAEYQIVEGRFHELVAPAIVARASVAPPPDGTITVPGDVEVDARWLLALHALAGGTTAPESLSAWAPLYGRPAKAQASWEREHGRPLENPARVGR